MLYAVGEVVCVLGHTASPCRGAGWRLAVCRVPIPRCGGRQCWLRSTCGPRPFVVSGAVGLTLVNSSSVQVACVAAEPRPPVGPRVLCHSGGAGAVLAGPVPSPSGGGLFMEVAGRSHRAGHLLKLPPLPTALRRCSSVPRRRQSGWPSMPRDCVPVPAATRSSATCDKASGQVHTRLPGVLLFSRTLIFTSDTRV